MLADEADQSHLPSFSAFVQCAQSSRGSSVAGRMPISGTINLRPGTAMSARDEGGLRPALIEIAASISAAGSLLHDLRRRGAWLHRAGAIPVGFSLPHR